MWKSMESAPKDGTEIYIANYWYYHNEKNEDVKLSFWGSINQDRNKIDNVWVDTNCFDHEEQEYYGYIENPLCWQEYIVPIYPTEEELASLE